MELQVQEHWEELEDLQVDLQEGLQEDWQEPEHSQEDLDLTF